LNRPREGSIVLVDWRNGALPAEPTKLHPAVVVEQSARFPEGYPNVLVVPLTRDMRLAHAIFAECLVPTDDNGASETSWALAHHVTSVSIERIRPTQSHIRESQLWSIRRRIALALGFDA
jgi:mRNA interferase MazF